ncbi:MAG: hypothetical protein PUP91_28400 [Rhizonema sp. PD37]|nr:hypothetical protein [Rhizonema sp. PD37]
MNLATALEDEKIATWYYSVNQLSTADMHWKQQVSLDDCVNQMINFVKKKDWLELTKVASKYYKKANCEQVQDYIANAWDRYLSVLFLMGVSIPEDLDLLDF